MQFDLIVQLNVFGIMIMCSLFFSLPKITNEQKPKRYFYYLYLLVFAILTLDTASHIITISRYEDLYVVNYLLTSVIHMANLAFPTYLFLIIINSLRIKEDIKKRISKSLYVTWVVIILLVSTNYLTGLMFQHPSITEYTRGNLFIIYPLIGSVLGFTGFYFLLKKGNLKSNIIHMNFLIASIISGIGGLGQSVFTDAPTYWVGNSIALIFIYAGVRGDISKINKETGLYNYRYQRSILHDYKEFGIPHVLIQFTPESVDVDQDHSFKVFASRIVSTFSDLGLFAANNDTLILLSKTSNQESLIKYIQKKRYEDKTLHFVYRVMEDNT